jgi:hypothetical protein
MAPTNVPAARPIRISTDEEFHKLDPGTEFIWIDNHVYRKEPEPESSEPQKGV